MSRMTMFLCLLLVVCAPLAAEHHEKEAASVYGGTLAMNFGYVSGQLVQLADAIPEGVYGWSPTDEVRTTSEVIMHVVGTNMMMPVMIGMAILLYILVYSHKGQASLSRKSGIFLLSLYLAYLVILGVQAI